MHGYIIRQSGLISGGRRRKEKEGDRGRRGGDRKKKRATEVGAAAIVRNMLLICRASLTSFNEELIDGVEGHICDASRSPHAVALNEKVKVKDLGALFGRELVHAPEYEPLCMSHQALIFIFRHRLRINHAFLLSTINHMKSIGWVVRFYFCISYSIDSYCVLWETSH
jgi:hypothetical protein